MQTIRVVTRQELKSRAGPAHPGEFLLTPQRMSVSIYTGHGWLELNAEDIGLLSTAIEVMQDQTPEHGVVETLQIGQVEVRLLGDGSLERVHLPSGEKIA